MAGDEARRFFGGWTWENSGFSGRAVDERTAVLAFAQTEWGFRAAAIGESLYR